jgi:hypothetical protein
MRASTIFFIVAAVLLVVMALAPQSDARIPRRKLHKLKKLAGIAFLLKGKKKILFPLPLPLPLPMPLLHGHHAFHEPIAEPFAFHEPLAEPLAHGYGHGLGHGHGLPAAEPAGAYW